jgi:hypothetical protein
MRFSASLRFIACFVPVTLVLATVAGGQTLEHRPPAELSAPTNAAPPSDGIVAAVPKQESTLLTGTSLQVEIARHYPMKAGETIEGRLMHPIYADGRLVVPEHTMLQGRVVALEPNVPTRWHGRLRGDFTPFHTVKVQFDELMLPGGPMPISAAVADDGAPVLQLSAPGATPHRGFISREWAWAKKQAIDRVAYVTAPGRGDRALQLLYHQLPYHPERIEAHTAWSFELTAPLALPDLPEVAPVPVAPALPTGKTETWSVNAVLNHDLTSARARPRDPVEALVVEPVFDRDKQLVVPQGSTLVGKVTAARAARSFGRNGKLRFTFQQVRFPEGFNRQVEGSLAGAATEKTQNLTLDAEGTITPHNQSSAIAPILLIMLAGRALDQDGEMVVHTGEASNGFGLVGRIVGVAAGNYNVAAGLGYYAAALSVYENFLRSGRDVVFPRDTRIEILTNPLRAPVLTLSGQ